MKAPGLACAKFRKPLDSDNRSGRRQQDTAVLEEIRALRDELLSLRQTLATQPSAQIRADNTPYHLSVFIEQVDNGRKPYRLTFNGALATSVKLSSIRLAVLFVLLVDLQRRSENQPKIPNLARAALNALKVMDPDSAGQTALSEKIRVTMYRCAHLCNNERRLHDERRGLVFNEEEGVLELSDGGVAVSPQLLSLEIVTEDDILLSALEAISSDSLMTLLRAKKALFVAPGQGGLDRLLLELYQHEFPMRMTSLYFRPAAALYPQLLLEKIGALPALRERSQIISQGLSDGRYSLTEVLHLSALDDFLRYSPQSGFKGYPPGVDVEDIVAHLDHLMEMIKTYSGYELVLTPAPLPFYFVTYDITRASRDELITIFFRHAAPGYFDAVSGFGVYDQAFGKTILRNVVSWIMKDPSSIREKEQVLEVLEAVKKRVLARDFLPYTAEEHVLERIQTPAENRRYLSFGGASMPEEAKTGLRRRSL